VPVVQPTTLDQALVGMAQVRVEAVVSEDLEADQDSVVDPETAKAVPVGTVVQM
jgi:hypothetical protein